MKVDERLMRELRDVVLHDRPVGANLDQEQRDALVAWLDRAADVRELQRTKSKTRHHEQLMEAYGAACLRWEAELEEYARGHKAEAEEFAQMHPRPLFSAFLRAHRENRPNVCPMCGSELDAIASDAVVCST
jgi:hypothetical protein